jgi:hypothetical protein
MSVNFNLNSQSKTRINYVTTEATGTNGVTRIIRGGKIVPIKDAVLPPSLQPTQNPWNDPLTLNDNYTTTGAKGINGVTRIIRGGKIVPIKDAVLPPSLQPTQNPWNDPLTLNDNYTTTGAKGINGATRIIRGGKIVPIKDAVLPSSPQPTQNHPLTLNDNANSCTQIQLRVFTSENNVNREKTVKNAAINDVVLEKFYSKRNYNDSFESSPPPSTKKSRQETALSNDNSSQASRFSPLGRARTLSTESRNNIPTQSIQNDDHDETSDDELSNSSSYYQPSNFLKTTLGTQNNPY